MDNPPFAIIVDDSAIKQIETLRQRQNLGSDCYLRIAVTAGGCSGFRYEMNMDQRHSDDDTVFSNAVVVDSLSLKYLQGARISFQSDLTGAQFKIENPMAVSGCGCGSSFSV